MIKEDLSSKEGLQVSWNYKAPMMTQESFSDNPIAPDSIMVDYEAIHVGPTRNFTWYTEQALAGSVPTWTKPYLRPLIMHHNEKDGKIIGRIHHASYTDKRTLSNTGALLLTANVPDKEGKEGIQDGRLKTVSIGAIVHEAHCSICNHNIAEEGPCEHERGVEYDGKMCYWVITKMEAKELSYVIVPSDIYAQHVKVYKPSQTKKQITESFEGGKSTMDTIESKVIDENGQQAPETVATPEATETKAVETCNHEAEIAELKAEKVALEDKVKELTKALEAEKEAAAKAAEDLKNTQVLLTKANQDITTIRAELATKESELEKEISLRESLEGQLIQDKANKRNELVESVLALRTQLGKREIAKEELAKKSDEFLQESLEDLQEEAKSAKQLDIAESTEVPTEVTNPGIVENVEENTKPIVKENKQASNINIEEAMADMMSAIMTPSRGVYNY